MFISLLYLLKTLRLKPEKNLVTNCFVKVLSTFGFKATIFGHSKTMVFFV